MAPTCLRLPLTLCIYHPHISVTPPLTFSFNGQCGVCVCLWASNSISSLRLTETSRFQSQYNTKFLLHDTIVLFCKSLPHPANKDVIILSSLQGHKCSLFLFKVLQSFYWIVAAFCFCYVAHSVDSRECIKKISAYCNIFSVYCRNLPKVLSTLSPHFPNSCNSKLSHY